MAFSVLQPISIYVSDEEQITQLWRAFSKLGDLGFDRVAIYTVEPTTCSPINPHYIFDLYWDASSSSWKEEIADPQDRMNPSAVPLGYQLESQDHQSHSLAPSDCIVVARG